MTRTTDRVNAKLSKFQARVMKVKAMRLVMSLVLGLINLSREFYTARLILLSGDRPPKKVQHS